LPEETFITAATIWFVIAYMPASTVGYTLLPIPPRIRIVPRSTNNSTPNAAYPIVLCGRILANAAVPLVLTDALHASDLLPKMRIRFDSHASNVAEDDENTLWTDSQDYGADEILYTTGIVLIDKTGKLIREITTLFWGLSPIVPFALRKCGAQYGPLHICRKGRI